MRSVYHTSCLLSTISCTFFPLLQKTDKLMFIEVLWLRTKRMKISNTVGVDVLGDPKINEFNFRNSYAQTLITKGFHQFYNCKSVRRGAPGTSPPTKFVRCHFISANRPTNQNLKQKSHRSVDLWLCFYWGIKPSKMDHASASRMASKSSRSLTVQYTCLARKSFTQM